MGCDIHVFFEEFNGKEWVAGPFLPVPHDQWWFERLLYNKPIETHMIAFGTNDASKAIDLAEEYYKSIPQDKILEKFSPEDVVLDWMIPYEIRMRDYGFFSSIASVRGMSTSGREPKGIPSDLSTEVKSEVESWDGDGHSHSWIMVDELIFDPILSRYPQVKKIKEVIPNPEKTRMVFFFDN